MGTDRQPADSYDVAILGGGLAGLTLGLQLKQARPETSIFIAEKRKGPAPEAAFKVGESTVEVSAHYFADTIGAREHMDNDELHKLGCGGGSRQLVTPPLRSGSSGGSTSHSPSRATSSTGVGSRTTSGTAAFSAGVDRFGNCRVQDVDVAWIRT